jgi:hypothetical protein
VPFGFQALYSLTPPQLFNRRRRPPIVAPPLLNTDRNFQQPTRFGDGRALSLPIRSHGAENTALGDVSAPRLNDYERTSGPANNKNTPCWRCRLLLIITLIGSENTAVWYRARIKRVYAGSNNHFTFGDSVGTGVPPTESNTIRIGDLIERETGAEALEPAIHRWYLSLTSSLYGGRSVVEVTLEPLPTDHLGWECMVRCPALLA